RPTRKVVTPSRRWRRRFRTRTRFACRARRRYHASPNRPWTTIFGSLLLGWPTSVTRLSENATRLRRSSTVVVTAKYAGQDLVVMSERGGGCDVELLIVA